MEVQVKVRNIWNIGGRFVSLKYFHIYPNDYTNRIIELNIFPIELNVQLSYGPRIEFELRIFNLSIFIGGGRV